MVTSSKRAYATGWVTKVCCSQSPCPCGKSLLTRASTGDTQALKGKSGSVSVGPLGPGVHKVLFEHFWQVWGLILNATSLLLPSCWDFSLALDMGYHYSNKMVESKNVRSSSPERTFDLW